MAYRRPLLCYVVSSASGLLRVARSCSVLRPGRPLDGTSLLVEEGPFATEEEAEEAMGRRSAGEAEGS